MPSRGGKTRHIRNDKSKPWEPTAEQLSIYAEVIEGRGTYEEIGKRHRVVKSRVHVIVKRINEWLVLQHVDDIREIKVEHTQRLLHQFKESMQAWERSKENVVTVRVKNVALAGVEMDGTKVSIPGIEETTTTVGQAGNPSFLSEARAALREIREIWGANAPVKVEHSGELRVAGMDIEEARRQLAEKIDQAKVRLLAPNMN